MLNAILYYVFVLPLSWLPMWLLHGISRLLFLLLFYVIPYRKKLVFKNLRNSFPEKSEQEIKVIARDFYLHFADLIVESVKNLSISQKDLVKRMKVKNPEVIQALYEKNRSVLMVSGHYNNWELLITAQQLILPHQAVGIGKPLTNKFWDKKLNERRARFGMRIINAQNVKEKMEEWKDEPTASLVLSDQSPGDSHKSYWMNFLNQPTAVLFGAELMANMYDFAVVYFQIDKVKRGYYEISFENITTNPREEAYGFITEQHTKMLEKAIQERPEFWVWTHKRWKREIPKDLNGLKEQQKTNFNKKFRK